ncbi:MAG: GGDEF domain-containing protein [Clostridiaceae bacterium]|nr:GGDEF domain-containing protein [Clostridiaceae bacterium]
MKKTTKHFWIHKRISNVITKEDYKEVEEYNEKMLSTLLLMGGILMLLPLLAAPFSNARQETINVYSITTLGYFSMYFIFKLPAMRRHTLAGLYICFSIFFMLAIYLSIINTPNMRATVLLGVFCVMPLSFIDYSVNINLFSGFWFIVHTILTFYLKPLYVLDDALNCFCFAVMGCFFGSLMRGIHLNSIEVQRLLVLEKGTDVLTGLLNRRMLYETLAYLENGCQEKPSGFLMIDIDNFKAFNDDYGHAAGDRCLNIFGKVLRKYTENYKLSFYRYGGEEFVAIAYDGYDKNELFHIAEGLRIAIQNTDMDGHSITASIGAAYCGNEEIQNYEKVIDRADKSIYVAKRSGRNMVYMEPD